MRSRRQGRRPPRPTTRLLRPPWPKRRRLPHRLRSPRSPSVSARLLGTPPPTRASRRPCAPSAASIGPPLLRPTAAIARPSRSAHLHTAPPVPALSLPPLFSLSDPPLPTPSKTRPPLTRGHRFLVRLRLRRAVSVRLQIRARLSSLLKRLRDQDAVDAPPAVRAAINQHDWRSAEMFNACLYALGGTAAMTAGPANSAAASGRHPCTCPSLCA